MDYSGETCWAGFNQDLALISSVCALVLDPVRNSSRNWLTRVLLTGSSVSLSVIWSTCFALGPDSFRFLIGSSCTPVFIWFRTLISHWLTFSLWLLIGWGRSKSRARRHGHTYKALVLFLSPTFFPDPNQTASNGTRPPSFLPPFS